MFEVSYRKDVKGFLASSLRFLSYIICFENILDTFSATERRYISPGAMPVKWVIFAEEPLLPTKADAVSEHTVGAPGASHCRL